MRYHIVTIVSVFLALGIGIFIGFILDAQDILIEEREDIVKKLELNFKSIEEEKHKTEEELKTVIKENENYKKFNEDIFIKLIEDRLAGANILLVQIDEKWNCSDINNMLNIAGANVSQITLYKKNLINNIDKLNAQLLGEEFSNKENLLVESFYPEILNQIIFKESDVITTQSIKENLIRVNGRVNNKIDYFILVGGINDNTKKDMVYKGVTNYLLSHNKPVMVIEKGKLKNSFIDFYQKNKMLAIDNLDTIIGKVSLVFKLEDLSKKDKSYSFEKE